MTNKSTNLIDEKATREGISTENTPLQLKEGIKVRVHRDGKVIEEGIIIHFGPVEDLIGQVIMVKNLVHPLGKPTSFVFVNGHANNAEDEGWYMLLEDPHTNCRMYSGSVCSFEQVIN